MTGEVVYDPFSGRGTTVLEACLLGRVGLGSDASPLACVLSAAKTQPPRPAVLRFGSATSESSTARRPRRRAGPCADSVFDDKTLKQLVWLRKDAEPGQSHGSVPDGGAARDPAPQCAQGWDATRTVRGDAEYVLDGAGVCVEVREDARPEAAEVDVFDALEARVRTLGSVGPQFRPGRVWRQDVRKPIRWPAGTEQAKLVFTSPPYLQVMKYGKMNWLRLWMLGEAAAEVDAGLFASASVPRYLGFMSEALRSIRSCVRDDGYVCLVIGDVRRGRGADQSGAAGGGELRGGDGPAGAATRR